MKNKNKKPIRAIDTYKHFLMGMLFLFLSVSVFLLVHANFFSFEEALYWIVGAFLAGFLMYVSVTFFIFFYWANKLRRALNGNPRKKGDD